MTKTLLVQRVLVTTDLPSWDLQLRSDPPSYALGAFRERPADERPADDRPDDDRADDGGLSEGEVSESGASVASSASKLARQVRNGFDIR